MKHADPFDICRISRYPVADGCQGNEPAAIVSAGLSARRLNAVRWRL